MSSSSMRKSNEVKMDENLFIVDLPSGKKYMGAKDDVHQPAQKGGTCWYYTFNWLRPRIGKFETSLVSDKKGGEVKENPDLDELLKRRKIERVLSQHRKQISKLDEEKLLDLDLSKRANSKEEATKLLAQYKEIHDRLVVIKDSKATSFFELLFPGIGTLNLSTIKKDLDLLDGFIKQSEAGNLKSFVKNKYYKEYIAVCESTLRKLGHSPSDEIHKQIGLSSKPGREEKGLSLEEKDLLYHSIIIRVAAEEYHLQFSTWHPADGFNSLMKALRKEGALAVGSTMGIPFYEEKAKSSGKKLRNYEVFYWPKGAKRREGIEDAHEILIVGAQRINTGEGKVQETILFRDPNDASMPGEPIKLYRASYDALCHSIQNIYGTKNKTGGTKLLRGPFAYCANPQYKKELEQHYSRVISRR